MSFRERKTNLWIKLLEWIRKSIFYSGPFIERALLIVIVLGAQLTFWQEQLQMLAILVSLSILLMHMN